ncbi:MAG TPA: carbon monoxide dehydrogenase beta subunit family protein [Nitrospiria bacterium]|nr:carbon monoxide dehydrogenase beta subunit family protein [Nitrospiria bacterium]
MEERYRVLAGPEAYLPPAAACMGIVLPDPGQAHIEGRIVPEEEAMEHVARKFLEAKVPIIYPGPLVLWNWNEKAAQKAKAIKILADTIPARIIPMPDYRPKYPKINPEVEINPNHPNLTIWHNKNDVCMFVGVHCHLANLSLKIIRAGTSCYTIAMCAQAGHEDAMVSFRDATAEKIMRLAEWVSKLKNGGIPQETVSGDGRHQKHS